VRRPPVPINRFYGKLAAGRHTFFSRGSLGGGISAGGIGICDLRVKLGGRRVRRTARGITRLGARRADGKGGGWYGKRRRMGAPRAE
jgi:hypothetical protein